MYIYLYIIIIIIITIIIIIIIDVVVRPAPHAGVAELLALLAARRALLGGPLRGAVAGDINNDNNTCYYYDCYRCICVYT